MNKKAITTTMSEQEKQIVIQSSKEIGITPSTFIRMVSLKEAKKILENKLNNTKGFISQKSNPLDQHPNHGGQE